MNMNEQSECETLHKGCVRWCPSIRSISWLLLAAAFSVYTYFYAVSVQQSVAQQYPSRTFSVEGSSVIEGVPEVATFSVSVVTEGSMDAQNVLRENAEKMNAISNFLKGEGIDAKDLETSEYSLAPRYEALSCASGICPEQKKIGYTLTQSLVVKVRDREKTGALLSGVVEKGATGVSDIRFVTDDDTKARNEARTKAIEVARKKADALSKAGKFRIGKLVNISETTDPPFPFEGMGGAQMKANAGEGVPTPEPGSRNKNLQVMITYEIID